MIVFTHVPKTSGTSFRRALVEPNVELDRIYKYAGLRRYLLDRVPPQSFVWGHVPFGIHNFTRAEVRYITFLRDPVDRAVSYYYFVKDSDPALYKHPARDEADALSITGFYELPKYQNWQTRFLAGLQYHYLYPRLSDRLDRATLRRATANLVDRYCCFGLQERYEESLELFQRRLGWQQRAAAVSRQKKTAKRPALTELDQATRSALQEANRLDCALYESATGHFPMQ